VGADWADRKETNPPTLDWTLRSMRAAGAAHAVRPVPRGNGAPEAPKVKSDTRTRLTPEERAQAESMSAQLALREAGVVELADEIDVDFATHDLVEGLIPSASLVAVLGDSNSGKSAFVLDLACAIASGRSFRGRRTQSGAVLWLALEAARGAKARIRAQRLTNRLVAGAPLGLWTRALDLLEPRDSATIVGQGKLLSAATRQPLKLIVIDTLARAHTGDENASTDMGCVIRQAEAIKVATGATVLLIHHVGKDASRGGRGHSSLRAALDAELVVEGQSRAPRVVRVTKARDLEPAPDFGFTLEAVEVGRDADSLPRYAVVVSHSDAPPPSRSRPVGANQERTLTAMREWVRGHPGAKHITSNEMRSLLRAHGLDNRRRPEVLNYLVNARILTSSVGGYTVDAEMA
jgi:hypothetical protein